MKCFKCDNWIVRPNGYCANCEWYTDLGEEDE